MKDGKKVNVQKNQSKKEIIDRLMAKASLDFRCCGHHMGPKK